MFTIIVLVSSPQLRRKPINLFLIHQSFVDLVACVLTIIEEIIAKNTSAMAYPFVCHYLLTHIASSVAFVISTYNTMLLAVERHSAITKPLQYDSEKVRRRLPFVFGLTWIVCYALFSFVPATTRIIDNVCLVYYTARNNAPLVEYYGIHCFFFTLVLPLFVMIVCYTRMIIALRESMNVSKTKGVQSDNEKSAPSAHAGRMAQVNTFQTCLIMTALFLLCWVTNESGLLMYIMWFYPSLSNTHYSVGRILINLGCCLNPYVYALRYKDFQKQTRVLFKC